MFPTEVPEPVTDAGAYAAVMAGVLGLCALVWGMSGGRRWWAERKVNKAFQRQFREDWLGEPARSGVPARPGVMARLADMATDWDHLAEKVRKLERDVLKLRSEVTFLLTHRCAEQQAAPVQPPEDEEG